LEHAHGNLSIDEKTAIKDAITSSSSSSSSEAKDVVEVTRESLKPLLRQLDVCVEQQALSKEQAARIRV